MNHGGGLLLVIEISINLNAIQYACIYNTAKYGRLIMLYIGQTVFSM